jgi:hypothetical protein
MQLNDAWRTAAISFKSMHQGLKQVQKDTHPPVTFAVSHQIHSILPIILWAYPKASGGPASLAFTGSLAT